MRRFWDSDKSSFIAVSSNRDFNLDTLNRSPLTQAGDVAQRRCAEQAAILPAELGGAFIADLKRRGGGIQSFGEHQPPGFVQTQPFFVLQRSWPSMTENDAGRGEKGLTD